MNRAVVASLALFIVGSTQAARAADELRVEHYPEAAYIGEEGLFVVSAPTGGVLRVELEGRVLAEEVVSNATVEVWLALTESGMLRFHYGAEERAFDLVQASDRVGLRTRAGYLHSPRGAAILLARHAHPPKHDRRWETVTILNRLLGGPLPAATSGLVVGANYLRVGDAERLDQLTGSPGGFWSYAPVAYAADEVNAQATLVHGQAPTDIAVVATSAHDYERGINPLQYRIKIEWCLQALRARGCRRLYVALPPLDVRQAARFDRFIADMRAAARAHSAAVVVLAEPAATYTADLASWADAVMSRISNDVTCKSER